jgi:hypothetical protein
MFRFLCDPLISQSVVAVSFYLLLWYGYILQATDEYIIHLSMTNTDHYVIFLTHRLSSGTLVSLRLSLGKTSVSVQRRKLPNFVGNDAECSYLAI